MTDRIDLKILYVEDEPDLRERIAIVLAMQYSTVITAANGEEGLQRFAAERPDVVVCDIRMPVVDGLEMTRRVRDIARDTPIILCTAFTETEYLLKAIELGICAYVRKPLDCDELIEAIDRAAAPILQRRELAFAMQREQASLELLLGNSPAMQGVIRQAQRVAGTDFSVIIQGETGVGKSYLASLIHGLSPRRREQFVTVTVSSLSESLVESQLFGHLKGSFTGAVASARGLFEEADRGTLFLDDVDCATAAIQAKILHAVEQKQFIPVGGTKALTVDTRIIAASNRDLLADAREGAFRQDLYYRLADVTIQIPPLRERGPDIPNLSRKFLEDISHEVGREAPRLTSDALLYLCRYPWPGNIRELKSVMKRAVLFAGDTLDGAELAGIMSAVAPGSAAGAGVQTLEELKRHAVIQALAATGGKKMEAARLLGLDYSSFKRMLDRFRL